MQLPVEQAMPTNENMEMHPVKIWIIGYSNSDKMAKFSSNISR